VVSVLTLSTVVVIVSMRDVVTVFMAVTVAVVVSVRVVVVVMVSVTVAMGAWVPAGALSCLDASSSRLA